ncbi:hypothetical protein BDZ97DRAFT_1772103 [Flammula alnicola]|nr:hypothetical protein BDZ97DRAFT_1772103 [Flammula alnicola]
MSSGMFETSTTDRRLAGPSLPANRVTLGKRRITINDGSTSLMVNFHHHPSILPHLSGLSRPLRTLVKVGAVQFERDPPPPRVPLPSLTDGLTWEGCSDQGETLEEGDPLGPRGDDVVSSFNVERRLGIPDGVRVHSDDLRPRCSVVLAPQSRPRSQREGIRDDVRSFTSDFTTTALHAPQAPSAAPFSVTHTSRLGCYRVPWLMHGKRPPFLLTPPLAYEINSALAHLPLLGYHTTRATKKGEGDEGEGGDDPALPPRAPAPARGDAMSPPLAWRVLATHETPRNDDATPPSPPPDPPPTSTPAPPYFPSPLGARRESHCEASKVNDKPIATPRERTTREKVRDERERGDNPALPWAGVVRRTPIARIAPDTRVAAHHYTSQSFIFSLSSSTII